MTTQKKLTLVFCLLVLSIGGVLSWKATSTSGITNNEQFNQKIRNSLAELNLPENNNLAAINAVSDNLANYFSYRSGVTLNQTNKNLLRQTEQQFWDSSKKVSQSQLAQIITDVAFEKLVTLSDANVDDMAETFKGFNDSSLPNTFQQGRQMVKLRANGEGFMEPSYFKSQLKYARDAQIDSNNGGSRYPSVVVQMNRAALHDKIIDELSVRSQSLVGAYPDFFDGSKNHEMSPSQAILLTYSILSNDMLAGNQSDLQQKMTEMHQALSRFSNQTYPSPQGRNAYGANGYIYSSPLDILLDDSSINRVLSLINERS